MGAKTRRIRILPFLITFAFLGLFTRAGDFMSGIDRLSQEAVAQEAAASASEAPGSVNAGGDEQSGEKDGTEAAQTADATGAATGVDPFLMSRSELELLDDLARRREALDQRERDMEMRENLLLVAEQRIDNKIAWLSDLETRIESLVLKYETQENEQLDSLVKVYQAMKPKDAAGIFERLDMEIQLAVSMRMKESKMAPILAAMSLDGAQKLTTELAARAQLPDIGGRAELADVGGSAS